MTSTASTRSHALRVALQVIIHLRQLLPWPGFLRASCVPVSRCAFVLSSPSSFVRQVTPG